MIVARVVINHNSLVNPQIPQILEVDDVDEEPDLEVAKEDIERVQCAKALFEDDLQEFVLDGA